MMFLHSDSNTHPIPDWADDRNGCLDGDATESAAAEKANTPANAAKLAQPSQFILSAPSLTDVRI